MAKIRTISIVVDYVLSDKTLVNFPDEFIKQRFIDHLEIHLRSGRKREPSAPYVLEKMITIEDMQIRPLE